MAIESDSINILGGMVYIISLIIILYKRKYTFGGLVVHLFTFIATIQFINKTIMPLSTLHFSMQVNKLALVPFACWGFFTLPSNSFSILTPVLYFSQLLIYSFLFSFGQIVLNSKNKNIYLKTMITLGIIIPILMIHIFFNVAYLWDISVLLYIGVGVALGILAAKYITKYNAIKIYPEEKSII